MPRVNLFEYILSAIKAFMTCEAMKIWCDSW